MTEINIIGCGGVASYLVPALIKTMIGVDKKVPIKLIDGDVLEKRNLDRQIFPQNAIGENKAKALLDYCKKTLRPANPITAVPEYFHSGMEVAEKTIFFCCADNHKARNAVMTVADRCNAYAVIGGNEMESADAYVYVPKWFGTEKDPRVRYPEITTSEEGDPLTTEGCGTEQSIIKSEGQTPLANFMAAAFMLHLFYAHFVITTKDASVEPYLTYEHRCNFNKLMSKASAVTITSPV